MATYLISFPSAAMVVPDGEWEAARIAKACRCDHELRVFGFDRQS
ncbi:MAG: hypothetical protein ACYC3F_03880 [Gemmatimonadaceae bacterium]